MWPRCNVRRAGPETHRRAKIERAADGDAGERSERACPVCGAHALAVDVPPRIDVMGFQAYSDIVGMGDRPQEGSLGIVCRACGTYWRDLEAFERGEAEPAVDAEADPGGAGGEADVGGEADGDDRLA